MNRNSYRFRLGEFECMALRDATDDIPWTSLVPEAYRPTVLQTLAERGLSTEAAQLDFLCLVVRGRGELIVIDTGIGFTEGVQGKFLDTLRAEGISPDDVTLVLLTHHDRDHLAGVIARNGTLAFPNARHVLTSEGWTWHTSEANLAVMPEPHAVFHRSIRSLLEGRVTLMEGESEVAPGIRSLRAPGHRPGHVVFEISSQGKRLLHLADTITHPLFVEHPEWGSGFDNAPDDALATRRRFLALAAAEGALVLLSHFPFPGLGHITRSGETYRWRPVDSTEA